MKNAPTQEHDKTPHRGALEGMTILEWCTTLAGAFCGKLLADMGAEVVKVERPGAGDPSRARGPFPGDTPNPEASGAFLYFNTNKKGVTLDVERPTGRALFLDLLRKADALVVDRTRKQMKFLGLDYPRLEAHSPLLVFTTVTPYGWTGPNAEAKAYPLNIAHAGGEGFLLPGGMVNWGRPPVKVGYNVNECDAGMAAATATLAALFVRDSLGAGQHVDISAQDVVLWLYRLNMATYTDQGFVTTRNNVSASIGGCLPCKDGYVQLFMAGGDKEWQALVETMGSPEWTQDERFRTEEGRMSHRDEVYTCLVQWTIERTKREVFHQAQAHHTPIGMFSTTGDLLASEQMKARQFFAVADHPGAGPLTYATAPYRMSATPWQARRAAPLLGQHNHDVFCAWLGLSDQELVRLAQQGVV
ncbi:MAG: CoA transferase [Chloroflexi bacterium]|nr:CoA transferase [Chloroflexota bacterium]